MSASPEGAAEEVYKAICEIASRCDGALSQDGVGFNGQDTKFGRRIALIPFEEWTQDILFDAAVLVGTTYRGQAESYTGIDFSLNPISIRALETDREDFRPQARQQARAAEKARLNLSRRFARKEGDRITFSFPFDGDIKDALKAAGCRFNGADKTWWIEEQYLNRDIVNIALTNGFKIDDGADAAFDLAADKPVVEVPVGSVKLGSDGRLAINLTGNLAGASFGEFRSLDGYVWERGTKNSTAAATPRNIAWLKDHKFTGDCAEIEASIADKIAAEAFRTEASSAADSELDLSPWTPEGLTPYPFQVAGVDYALRTRRCFIADEMGLGKTVQAVLAVEAAASDVTVVVCPASLKGNWAKEIGIWAPEATVAVLSGRKGEDTGALRTADYIIVNYDILSAWADTLAGYAPDALVVDESHYAKELKSQRTQAVLKLSAAVPASGLVLLLTGTPILNRPIELITQLRILGKLEEVAPTPRRGTSDRDYEFSFKFAYCGPEKNRYGWVFNKASNTKELNDKLRASCFVRREREDVLGLLSTKWTRIALSLNGALKDYRRAETDLIAFLKAEKGDEAAQKAKRAEVLVGLNTLRRLAEEAKVGAGVEWVQDWLDSNPTRKLVIFADHISTQHALVEAFSCPHILGGEKDPEGQKAAFQEGSARVIVCSLKAAREGHTLTAASDVVFFSLGWTPGGLQQAEDRCNRIGQTADVVAWQLTAEGTIDEWVGELIEEKRVRFNGVVKGDVAAADEIDENIQEAIIGRLIERGE